MPAPKTRKVMLGFQAHRALMIGEQMRMTARPQTLFRGERFVIPDEFKDASIHSICVGNREQLQPGSPLPAGVFLASAGGMKIDIDSASVAQDIVITVSRPSGGDFNAVLVGSTSGEPFFSSPMFEELLDEEPLVDEAAAALKDIDEAYEPGVTLEELEALLGGEVRR